MILKTVHLCSDRMRRDRRPEGSAIEFCQLPSTLAFLALSELNQLFFDADHVQVCPDTEVFLFFDVQCLVVLTDVRCKLGGITPPSTGTAALPEKLSRPISGSLSFPKYG